MFKWKVDIVEELKARGVTFTSCRKTKVLSQSVMTRLNHNDMVDIDSLDKLCRIFNCDIGDLIEHIKDDNDEE